MGDSMIFIMQTVRMILKEEGPMERDALKRRVAEQMHPAVLDQYIDPTIDVMIRSYRILENDQGKLYMRAH